MKYRYLYCAVFSAFVGFTSCQDDVIENAPTPWQEGDGIAFGARAGYEKNGDSRTIYSGEKYETGGKTYERVDWVSGDQIGVFCAEASNPSPITVTGTLDGQVVTKDMGNHYGEYVVVDGTITHPTDPNTQSGTNESYAEFKRPADVTGSLQWGGQVPHTFYAVYPSVTQNWSLDINKNTVTGRIAPDQTPFEIEKVGNDYIARPVMRQAYMVAKSTVIPDVNGSKTVDLTFQSIVTALEIELVGSAAANTGNEAITGVQISSKNNNITGQFSCDLDNFVNGYPKCDPVQTANASRVIRVGLKNDDGTSIKLSVGQKLKFTVFMLPVDDLNDLSISIYGLKGSTSRPLTINGTGQTAGITFSAHKKHYIAGVKLPRGYQTNNWITRLQDNVLLSQLSIPGTGNSCSYKSAVTDRTQSLSIEEQWNLGIRCFEIMSTYPDDPAELELLPTTKVTDLGDAKVRTSKYGIATYDVGGATTELDVRTAYNKIASLLNTNTGTINNTGEFAVIIFNFQPVRSNRRSGAASGYLKALETFLNNNSYARIAYSPNLTVGECRGKIMVIARPTSEGEDEGTATPARTDYLMVDGWGSLQDKWKQRGYVTHANIKVENNAQKEGVDVTKTVEYSFMKINDKDQASPDLTKEINPYKKDTQQVDYTYPVVSNSISQAYIQEWPRVIKDQPHNAFRLYTSLVGASWIDFQWQTSYNEKLADLKSTFEKSLADKNHSMLYINSLCGYYVDETKDESRTPLYKVNFGTLTTDSWGSTYGDFFSYSNDINRAFYSYVLQSQNEHTTGPMGIIMMNFVGDQTDQTAKEANLLMPGVVVANNFSFPLKTSDK